MRWLPVAGVDPNAVTPEVVLRPGGVGAMKALSRVGAAVRQVLQVWMGERGANLLRAADPQIDTRRRVILPTGSTDVPQNCSRSTSCPRRVVLWTWIIVKCR
jgi:hypothetical protein